MSVTIPVYVVTCRVPPDSGPQLRVAIAHGLAAQPLHLARAREALR